MSWLSDLFGGGDSHAADVKYPDWYSDPNFAGSQGFLDQYSKDLLNNGPNDYYAPIGEYNTPEFQAAVHQSSQATVGATDAALARSGRARGGQGAAIAAQTIGDQNAKLAYADYLRAMNGREMFLKTGLGVQENVRDAGFANQGARNNFNVGGAKFNMDKAIYGDSYDRQNSQDIGEMLGNIAPLVAGGVGFMVGGPAGASVGYGAANSLFGGDGSTPQWLDTLTSQKTKAAPDQTAGVSTLGRINPEDFLKNYSKFNFGG